jgi:hypothetical protein
LHMYAGKNTTSNTFGSLVLQHDGTESRGNVLIGTTTNLGYKLQVQGSIHASGDGSSVSYWVPSGAAIRGTAATGGTMYIDGSQDSSGTINLRATSIVASGAFSAGSIASGSINVTGDYVRVSNGPNPPSFRLNNSSSGADWYIETHRGAPSGSLEITNSLGTAGLTLFSDRNVSINSNTNSGHKLQVTGTVSLASLTVAGSSQDALCIVNGGTEVQRNNGAQTCTVSSARFKHDIEPLQGDILNTLSQFTPSTFIYNDQTNLRIGLIAEEVHTIDPRLVFYEEDGITPRGVRYEDLSVMTLKGVQEIIVSMNSLETLTTPNTLRNSLIVWLGSIENGIGKIFAKKVETEELCIKKSNGALVCVTGDQLEQFITTQNSAPASATTIFPSETPSEEGVTEENISIETSTQQEVVIVEENQTQEVQEVENSTLEDNNSTE